MSDNNQPVESVLEDECRRICQTLGIDTVQIVATDFDSNTNKTMTYRAGFGNWFARRDSLCSFAEYLCNEELTETSGGVDPDEL